MIFLSLLDYCSLFFGFFWRAWIRKFCPGESALSTWMQLHVVINHMLRQRILWVIPGSCHFGGGRAGWTLCRWELPLWCYGPQIKICSRNLSFISNLPWSCREQDNGDDITGRPWPWQLCCSEETPQLCREHQSGPTSENPHSVVLSQVFIWFPVKTLF